MAPFALSGRTVVFDLRDVPYDLRVKVAEKLAVREGLRGVAYLELMLAAEQPRGVALEVDAAKAEVVRAGKQPPGPTPAFWTPVLRERWR